MPGFAIRRLQDLCQPMQLRVAKCRPYIRFPLSWFFNCYPQDRPQD